MYVCFVFAQAHLEVVASLFVLELGAVLSFGRVICSSNFINYLFFCCYVIVRTLVTSIL